MAQSLLAPIYRKLDGWPLITLVVAGRRDLYDGDLGRRLAATLEWNLGATRGQAIYVEWNPPPDSPLDAAWLLRRFAGLRVHVVGPERHQALSTNPTIPAMEYRDEFDHRGSYKRGSKAHHGDEWDFRDGVPYRNSDGWGLGRARERQIGDRTWYIE